MPDKVSPSQFAASVKEKYPQYKDVDDLKLTNAMIEKYPEYKDVVDFGIKVAPAAPVAVAPAQPPVSKYQKAVNDDRSEIGKTLSTLYNNAIASLERFGGAIADLPAQFSIATPGFSPVDIGKNWEDARAFREQPLSKRLESAKQLKQKIGKAADVVRSGYTTREEEKAMVGQFNVMDGGIGLRDIQSLIASSGGMALDMGLGAVTGGTSFVLQGYNDAVEDYDAAAAKAGLEPSEGARGLYGIAGGVINGLLEKFAVDKIVGDTPVFRDIQRKAIANVLKNTAGMTGKKAVDAIETAAVAEIKKLTNDWKRFGIRSAYRAGIEGGTESVQAALEDGAKFAANAVQGNEVFNEDEIKKGFFQNIVNSGVAGSIMGPVFGASADKLFGRNVNAQVLQDIAEANTPEQLAAINDELAATFDENNFTQEERDAVMANANRYAQIKQTLPQGTSALAQTIAIPLIEDRIKLDNEIQNRKNNIENVDEALRTDEEASISLLEDKRAQINDDIREVVTDEKFNYFEQDGKFFKQLGQNAPEEISRNRFDLQQLKTANNATQTGQGTVQEGGTTGNIGQRQGTQEEGTQGTVNEADTGYRYIVSEEGSEFPITALVNKKVRKDGRPAILYQEGQRVVARILGTNRIEDVGNVVEMMDALPQEFGIEVDETVVTETPTGYRVEGEDMVNDNENPLDAISVDQNGKVMNVVLKTPSGKRRKFRGQAAQDLAYQITLKETLKNEDEFELFLEQEHQAELDAAEAKAAAEAETAAANEPVPTTQEPATTESTTGATTGGAATESGVGVSTTPAAKVLGLSKDDRTSGVVLTAMKLIKMLRNKMPNLDIVIHDTEESYNVVMNGVGGVVGSAGAFSYSKEGTGNGVVGRIDINLSKADARTVRHEVAHALMLYTFGDNPKLFKKFRDKISAVIDQASNDRLTEFASQYDEEVSHEEYLVELAAILSGQATKIESTTLEKIARIVNEIISSITGGMFKPFQNIRDADEVVEFFNNMADSLQNGTEYVPTRVQMAYRETDTNSLGLSGEINATGVTSKSSISSGDIKRFPVNPNATVQEDVPLSSLNGKRVNLMESDRMTGGYIANSEGNPLYKFYGGVFYPIITGKWWASRNATKAKGLARNANKNRDADGYVYSAPMIGSANQHMSNNDMLATTFELMKYDLKDKKSKVKKEDVIGYINKAFSRKKLLRKLPVMSSFLSKTETINDIFNNLEFYLFQEGKDIINRDGKKVLDGEGKPIPNFTFEERKMIVESILGDPKVKDTRFPSAGSISDAAKRFEEPITSKATRLGDMVTVMRTKGTLKWKKSDPSDPFYHKSYPVEIYAVDENGNPAQVEVMILDGAYSMRDVLPSLDKSSGESFTWEDYLKKHKKVSEAMAESQYNRTAKLSYASGVVSKAQKAPNGNASNLDIKNTNEEYKGLPLSNVTGTVYHRTNASVDSIVKDGFAVPNQGKAKFGYGVYFNPTPKETSFGRNMVSADVDGLKMVDLTEVDPLDVIQTFDKPFTVNGSVDYTKLTKELKDNGIDGVITEDELVVFDPSKINNPTRVKSQLAPTKPVTKERGGIIKKGFKEQVRYGILGKENVKLKELMSGELSAELATAETRVKETMKTIKKYGGSVTEKDISDFMQGNSNGNQIPLDLATQLSEMRAQIDGLTERLIQLGVVDSQESIDYYRDNMGKYMLRSYESINFKDTKTLSVLYGKGLNIDNVAKKLKNVDRTMVNAALKQLSDKAKAAYVVENALKDGKVKVVEFDNDNYALVFTSNNQQIAKFPKDSGDTKNKAAISFMSNYLIDPANIQSYNDIKATVPNVQLSDDAAFAIAKADANEILSSSEDYIMNKGLTGSTNVKSLRERKDISPEIRALMGEYTDPLYNYYSTIFKISSLTSSRQYLNSLKEFGMGNFFFENKTEDATVKFAGDESDALAPLNGIWTFPEIKESLQIAQKETTSMYAQMAGRVRMLKTVYNPSTHVKNIIGNMGFAVSNGHWNNLPEAYKYIKGSIKGGSNKDVMQMMDTLNRYGVLNNVIGVGELKSYFDNNESIDDFLKTIYNNANQNTTASKLGKAKANLSKIPKAIEKAYAIEDDVFKILAFVNESNRYAQAIYKKKYDKLSDTEKKDIDGIASEIVKDTFPTFSRVPKGVKTLSKFAFLGNFLSFPVESVRTQYNSLALAKKEIMSGNSKLRTIGLTRLSGAIAYNSIFSTLTVYAYNLAGAGLTGALGAAFGDDEKESTMWDSIKKYLAPWNKNSEVYVSKFKDGKLEYYDIGSLDSYGYQRRVWNAFWSTKNKGEFDKMMASSISEALDPWMAMDMVYSNLMSIARNDDGLGGKVYNPEAKPMDRSKEIAIFVGKQFGPGALGSAIKIADAYQKGETDKVMDEFGAQVFARRYSVDLNKQFQNYIYTEGTKKDKEVGFKDRLSDARNIYLDAKRQNLDAVDLSRKYQEALEQYKEILLTANGYYKAALMGGTNPKVLIQSLVKSRVGRAEAIAIVTGAFGKYDQAYIRK